MQAFYFDQARTIINIVDGETTMVVEQSSPIWAHVVQTMNVAPYVDPTPPVPPPPPVATLQLQAKAEICTLLLAAERNAATGLITPGEMASWSEKRAAAAAVASGSGSPDQQAMIDAERALTGETRAELTTRIAARAALYAPLSARIAGLRRKHWVAIEAAATAEDLATALADAAADIAATLAG